MAGELYRLFADLGDGQFKPAVEWFFQWPEWFKFGRYNWVNFELVHIGLEAGCYKGQYLEFTFIVLGVGFFFELYHAEEREQFIGQYEWLTETEAGHD